MSQTDFFLEKSLKLIFVIGFLKFRTYKERKNGI